MSTWKMDVKMERERKSRAVKLLQKCNNKFITDHKMDFRTKINDVMHINIFTEKLYNHLNYLECCQKLASWYTGKYTLSQHSKFSLFHILMRNKLK